MFQVKEKLGSGAFGDVFAGEDIRTGAPVAIKMENVDVEFPQLLYESRVMQELQDAPGIPRCFWFGKQDDMNALVMQKLGKCLGVTRMYSMADAFHVASEALMRLQTLHMAGFAHRDIKPENFVYGTGSHRDVLYIIDFGLCKRIVNPHTGEHIKNRTGKTMAGTPRYASIHMHEGMEMSRRDDIESLGYVMIFLLKGSLPWQGCSSKNNYEAVGRLKESIPLSELCKGLPPAFEKMLAYARDLSFTAVPDYRFLLSLWSVSAVSAM